MRARRIRILLSLLIIVSVAAGLALFVAITSVPSYTSDALTRALGRRVEVASIAVDVGLQLEIQLLGLRVYEGLTPTADETPLLEAPRAVGRQSLARVLIGQIVPLDWEMDAPVVRIDYTEPQPEIALPLRRVRATKARIEIETSRGRFVIDPLDADVSQSALLSGYQGELTAQITGPSGELGQLSARFEGEGRTWSVSGQLRGMVLSRLARLAQLDPSVASLKGRLSGSVELELLGDDLSAELQLAVEGLSAEVAALGDESVKPSKTQLTATVERRAGVWNADLKPLKLDLVEVTGQVSIGLAPERRVRADVAVAGFPAGSTAGLNPLALAGLRSRTFAALERALEEGRIEDISLRVDLPAAELQSALESPRSLAPNELTARARLVDARYRAQPESVPLESVNGRFELAGDRFTVTALRMRRDGADLPEINVSIDGYARFVSLPIEERRVPVGGPGVSLQGLAPAVRALRRSDDPEPGKPAPDKRVEQVLQFRDLRLDYPAFVFSIRDARGRMRFLEDRLVVESPRAVVAGGAAVLDVTWAYAPSKVDVALRYVDEESTPKPEPSPVWLKGVFEFEQMRVGGWTLEQVRGNAEAERGVLRMSNVTAAIGGGKLTSNGAVDLAQPGRAPLEFTLDVDDASAVVVTEGLGFEETSITGTANLDGRLQGRLDPAARFGETCSLSLDLQLRDGTLEKLPAALQLARLPSLRGVSGLFGRPLQYETVTGKMDLQMGLLKVSELAIVSSDIRVLAEGQIDLKTEENDTDMRVALLFLQTLDGMIEKVPYFGKLVLGDDQSLVTMSFYMRGAFADPSITLAPPSVLSKPAEWTTGMLRRLRDFIPIPIPGLRPSEPAEPEPQVAPLAPAVSDPGPVDGSPGAAATP